MSVSLWQDRSIRKANHGKLQKDVVIIGGGIAGLSTAYWLQKEDPSLSIAIVERGLIGSGASGRNAGFITCGSVEHFNRLVQLEGEQGAYDIWNFSEENLRLIKEHIVQEETEDILFENKGSFSLASTQEEFKELKFSAAIMEKMGIRVETLDGQQIRDRLGAEKFVGGIKYLDDASVHPIGLLDLMRKRIDQAEGDVSIYENNEVFDIAQEGDNKLVRTNEFSFEAPLIIMATNGYSPLVHDFFKDKITPTRGQILATSPVPLSMEAPCYANFVLDYFRQLPTGELILGGFRQIQKDVEVGYADITTDIIQDALEKFLHDHLPKFSQAKITHRWSGVMGFSSDGRAMIGALPSDPQIFFVGGFTCHGIGLAFHSGKCLVDALYDRKIPDYLSAKRFM